jgi:hypothetical protein
MLEARGCGFCVVGGRKRVRSRQDCGAETKSCLTYCGRSSAHGKNHEMHDEMQVR